jgi:hypothetical protein
MARQGIPILTLTLIATSVIATRRFVTPSGAQAGAGVNTMGVSDCEGAIGEALPVHAIGTAIVEAGGAITAGALVEADAEGRAIT